MKSFTKIWVPVFLLWCTAALAEDAIIELKQGNTISAPGSSSLALESILGASKVVQDVPVPAFRDTLVFNDAVIKAIEKLLPADSTAANALLLRDTNQKTVKRVVLASEQSAPAVGGAVVEGQRRARVANRADCRAAASEWQAANAQEWNRGKHALLVLFNRDAKGCYDSTQYARQGDTVYVGIVAFENEVESASVQFSQCSREPVEPNVYISGNPQDFIPHAGGFEVQIAEVRRCWDKEITLTANVKPKGFDPAEGTRPVSFFELFRGTLQFGALYTDLHQNDFGLVDSGGQNVIYNKEPITKGPEYVASLIVYGFPNYFTGDGWKKGYRGRDILNDNSWADRTGLVILAGLSDPSDRFGIGLSFELAYGINVFVTKQWFRQKELVGLAEGDVFAGAEDAITTKHDWQSDTSFGLSFDVRYIKALFTGK